MDIELTTVWSEQCSSGPTCPKEKSARYPDGRRTRIRVGRQVTDPELLAVLGVGPGEVANEVDEDLIP